MINDIRLQSFRSHKDVSFEFSEKVNIIVGPNGSGKTNLLESILVLAIGRSYRVNDADLLEHGSDWLRVDAHTYNTGVVRTVKILSDRYTKSYEINGKKYKQLRTEHLIPVVLFEPNHLLLLHGSPDNRRQYLDDILDLTTPGFKSFLANYKRVLSQRNRLLKRSKKPSQNELFPWNLRLSELGAAIARARAAYVVESTKKLPKLYKNLSEDKKSVSVVYKNQFPLESYESAMLKKLESAIDRDIDRGFTAYGPHREDFEVLFDDRPAFDVASRGETRTAILALKIIELEAIEKSSGKTPVLLLDDVFSELDGARRRTLTNYLQKYQTFLTTTDADVVVKHFTNCTIIPLGS